MLKNAPILVIRGGDAAENGPSKVRDASNKIRHILGGNPPLQRALLARCGTLHRQGGAGAPEGAERAEVGARVERYGSRATVSFESLNIRIPLQFCQNSAKLSQIFRNSENFRTS